MSRRKNKPSYLSEPIEAMETCKDCKLEDKCEIIKFINQVAMRKAGKTLTHEYGCVYFESGSVR